MKGLLFTFLACFGGAAAALFAPLVGLFVYVIFAILRPAELWFWSVPPFNYSLVVGVAFLIGWVFKGFGRWQFGKATPIVCSLLLFWIWCVISAITAPNQELAWAFVSIITKIVLPFMVGITLIDDADSLRRLIWTIAASEGYLAFEFNSWYFSGYNRLWLDGFGSVDNNVNAIALVTCAGLCFYLALYEHRRMLRLAAFIALVLMVHSVLFSFSRGGMLALIVTALTALMILPKKVSYLATFAVCVLLGLRLAGPEVSARFGTSFASEEERDTSAQSRLVLWDACRDVMMHHPLGVGAGQWGLVAPQYGFPEGKRAHSLWLEVGAELGFPGLLMLLSFYGLCIWRLWPLARQHTTADPLAAAARMVVTSLVGFVCAAQFVSVSVLEHPYYVALIGAATLKLASAKKSDCTVTIHGAPAVAGMLGPGFGRSQGVGPLSGGALDQPITGQR